MTSLRVVELFAGIGSQTQALKNLGIDHKVAAISEIDRFAIETYKKLHGETLNIGDISLVDPDSVPEHDLLTYSFPCTDISVSGFQEGLDENSNTQSSLLWECQKIIEAKRPKYLLLENVKNLLGRTHVENFNKWLDRLEGLGYTSYYSIQNATEHGLPQNRERVFVVSILGGAKDAFAFKYNRDLRHTVKDYLSQIRPENMYMNVPMIPSAAALSPNYAPVYGRLNLLGTLDMAGNESIKRVYDPLGICPTLTTMEGGHRQPKFLWKGRVIKLTPRECWLLMGFTEEQFSTVSEGMSNTQLYKQAGNSIAVPVLEDIFRELFKDRIEV